MKLMHLNLSNFKGCQSFELETGGGNVSIYGDNEAGKTTLFDGFCWLLFGKDSLGRAEFEIKTIGSTSSIEHSVAAVFELDEGRQLELKKVLVEKWQKKRGSAQPQFAGHLIHHFKDGVPCTKSVFDSHVACIAEEKLFPLITNPRHFSENLHWQKRRELLLEVCGDISDETIIKAAPQLEELPSLLGGKSLEDHRKVLLLRKTQLNKELGEIPPRISELSASMEKMEEDGETVRREISSLAARQASAQQQLAQLKSGGGIAQKKAKLQELEIALYTMEKEFKQEREREQDAVRMKLLECMGSLNEAERFTSAKGHMVQDCNVTISKHRKRMDQLREEWHSVNSEEMTYENVCPRCGQPLSQAAFNSSKAQKLREISDEGKSLSELACAVEQERDRYLQEMESLKERANSQSSAIEALEKELQQLKEAPAFQVPEEIAQSFLQLNVEIASLESGSSSEVEDKEKEIQELASSIYQEQLKLAKLDQAEMAKGRIEVLKKHEKELASNLEEVERQLHLTNLFIMTKVSLLEENINSKFQMARFKLFDTQINGGINECCEVTVNGVPYNSMNNAARINAGLDICSTFAAHFGIYPPVWIDNAEAVTRLFPLKLQQIRLIVSEPDKQLRIVKE